MGQSLTPTCLDADSLRYYLESFNGYIYLFVLQFLPFICYILDL